ncbi:hypothetical protein THFILI_04705 [Thermus filiformis]|uniref:Uncharacterized protein n=1 Tax=Thermus filiformis TaxID=276 RepID=A0A0D6XCK5_THEFI|nr:hypothetical protein THFILI_04705 [Thermus filiformis]
MNPLYDLSLEGIPKALFLLNFGQLLSLGHLDLGQLHRVKFAGRRTTGPLGFVLLFFLLRGFTLGVRVRVFGVSTR